MAEVNSHNIQIDVLPFTMTGLRLVDLHLREQLGGELPTGLITMMIDGSEESLAAIDDVDTGEIIIRENSMNGYMYRIPYFITERERNKVVNEFSMKVVCFPEEKFCTEYGYDNYKDIQEAIEFLYAPGRLDIRTESDCSSIDIPIYRCNETRLNLCTRLAYSYKKNSIFAYGWEGLLIKELPNTEEGDDLIFLNDTEFRQVMPKNQKLNTILNTIPENPWESDKYKSVAPRFATSIKLTSGYTIQRRGYSNLEENYQYNKRLMTGTGLYGIVELEGNSIPSYKIGDKVFYHTETFQDDKSINYLVCRSNEIFFSTNLSKKRSKRGARFAWNSEFLILERGTWSGEAEDESINRSDRTSDDKSSIEPYVE